MIMKTINSKNEITDITTDNSIIIARFLGLIFNKTIAKNNSIKKIQYSYNYTDMQKVTIIFDNNYKQVFDGIPTQWGLLDDTEITKLIKESEVK